MALWPNGCIRDVPRLSGFGIDDRDTLATFQGKDPPGHAFPLLIFRGGGLSVLYNMSLGVA